MFRHIGHLDRVAQVGLVRAIPQQRIAIGDQRPVRIDLFAFSEFFEKSLNDRLHRGKDVFLLHEAHLDVELIEVGRAAVGAGVFVAETGRDLEVAVKARHHDQLLELLRRLRQGVELARMQPRRHKEISRPFGRGSRDDRRLKLGEAAVPHPVAQAAHHMRTQHHVLMQTVAAQVKEAIGQPGFFGILRLAEDLHRQVALDRTQNFHVLDINFDFAGRDPGIHQRSVAQLHLAVDADHPFGADLFQRRKGRAVAVAQDLRDAVMVAQVDEQHAAVIAHPMHPAGQTNFLTRIRGAEGGAGMAAIGVHHSPLSRACRIVARSTAKAGQSQATLPAAAVKTARRAWNDACAAPPPDYNAHQFAHRTPWPGAPCRAMP